MKLLQRDLVVELSCLQAIGSLSSVNRNPKEGSRCRKSLYLFLHSDDILYRLSM